MKRLVLFPVFLLFCNLFTSGATHSRPLPANVLQVQNNKGSIPVPPPVLRAFQALLLEIADEQQIPLSSLSSVKAVWQKDKNTYTVHAEFGDGTCEEGGSTYTVMARFKANGEVILLSDPTGKMSRYLYSVVTCIRLPI